MDLSLDPIFEIEDFLEGLQLKVVYKILQSLFSHFVSFV